MTSTPTPWRTYLEAFHRERAGITEDLLGASRNDGIDPYEWVLEPLPSGGRHLDLACGSGPLERRRPGEDWVGLDRSAAELGRSAAGLGRGAPERGSAGKGGAPRLIGADATQLPLMDGSFRSVACSMAAMVVEPLDALLVEIRRVLSRDGTVVLLLPGTLPLGAVDLARWAWLMVALRRTRLGYPNDRALLQLNARARAAGLRVTDDRRRRFAVPLPDAGTGRSFVRSLYLPGTSEERVQTASELAASWRGEIGVPLRRVTLRPSV